MNIEQLHYDVLEGRSDYIPLVINTSVENPKLITCWEGMHDPQKYIDTFVHNNALNIQFPTDREIVMESNFLESLIPSMLGAAVYESPGGFIDVRPFIDDIEEAEQLDFSNLHCGQFDMAMEHLRYLNKNKPDLVKLATTRFMSPLDYAVVMRGGDFYLDLLLEPEKSTTFMNKIVDLTLKVMKAFKDEIGEAYNKQITVARGLYFHGTRLTGDAIVNLSPDLIKKVMCPLFNRFRTELGGVMLHYCCTPAPSGHVLPALAECDSVRCVDNWQGYKTYFNGNLDGLLQDKVSMCIDVPVEEVENLEKLFGQSFFSEVKRKNGRGLVVTTRSNNIEYSKRLYNKWQDYFVK